MINFILYTVSTGEIVATGAAGTLDAVNAQARIGQSVLIVPSRTGISPETHYVAHAADDDQPSVLVTRAQ
ncbi:hypothetical protein [Aquabacter cavernae]|uniref:hypothetical protein n=1 Tax=Aquabacter cavernae TaxID=2496029 RepID=UPI000F8F78CE|nr:hypothetical protein [Aquabacter cavernae]